VDDTAIIGKGSKVVNCDHSVGRGNAMAFFSVFKEGNNKTVGEVREGALIW